MYCRIIFATLTHLLQLHDFVDSTHFFFVVVVSLYKRPVLVTANRRFTDEADSICYGIKHNRQVRKVLLAFINFTGSRPSVHHRLDTLCHRLNYAVGTTFTDRAVEHLPNLVLVQRRVYICLPTNPTNVVAQAHLLYHVHRIFFKLLPLPTSHNGQGVLTVQPYQLTESVTASGYLSSSSGIQCTPDYSGHLSAAGSPTGLAEHWKELHAPDSFQ